MALPNGTTISLNQAECGWDAPTPMPTTNNEDFYSWNERELKWIKLDK